MELKLYDKTVTLHEVFGYIKIDGTAKNLKEISEQLEKFFPGMYKKDGECTILKRPKELPLDWGSSEVERYWRSTGEVKLMSYSDERYWEENPEDFEKRHPKPLPENLEGNDGTWYNTHNTNTLPLKYAFHRNECIMIETPTSVHNIERLWGKKGDCVVFFPNKGEVKIETEEYVQEMLSKSIEYKEEA